MPNIIELDDSVPSHEPTSPIPVAPERYRGSTHDIRFESAASIISHIAGRQLFVDYYQQIKGQDNINQGQAPGELTIHQQYKLIKNMEIRVTSPFSSSQDEATREMVVVASATMYVTGVIPDRGDMLVFSTGDGQYCMCEITTSRRKEFFKETTYDIDYQLKDFLTKFRHDDLRTKVIEEYVFDRNFLMNGRNPVIQTNDYDVLRKLEAFVGEAGRLFYTKFFSQEFQTIVVPSQGTPVYDPFLTRALPRLFDTDAAPEVRFVRQLNTDGDLHLSTKTIWDVLLDVDPTLLPYIATEYYVVSAQCFEKNPYYASIYYSGMRRVIYPKDPRSTYTHQTEIPANRCIKDPLVHVPGRYNAFQQTTMPAPDYDQLLGLDLPKHYMAGLNNTWDPDGDGVIDDPTQFDFDQNTNTQDMPEYYLAGEGSPIPETPPINMEDVFVPVTTHPYLRDSFYLFSEHFYKQNELLEAQQMSGLEKMVVRMLNKQSVGIHDLIEAIDQYRGWDALEQFYYVPVLVLLTKYTIYTY